MATGASTCFTDASERKTSAAGINAFTKAINWHGTDPAMLCGVFNGSDLYCVMARRRRVSSSWLAC